jgi:hypothetical protein
LRRCRVKLYAVRVFRQGVQQGSPLNVEAPAALEAMNEVEARLGLTPPRVSVDKGTGELFVTGYHSYEFRAKKLH